MRFLNQSVDMANTGYPQQQNQYNTIQDDTVVQEQSRPILPQLVSNTNLPNKKIRRGVPVSQLINKNPRYQKIMMSAVPIGVQGPKSVPQARDVVWKNVCMIGEENRECIIEMSYTKTKFYIVAVDLETGRHSVIELFRPQATKIIKACGTIEAE